MVTILTNLIVALLFIHVQPSGSTLLHEDVYGDKESLQLNLCPEYCSCHDAEIKCTLLTQSVLRLLDEELDRM